MKPSKRLLQHLARKCQDLAEVQVWCERYVAVRERMEDLAARRKEIEKAAEELLAEVGQEEQELQEACDHPDTHYNRCVVCGVVLRDQPEEEK